MNNIRDLPLPVGSVADAKETTAVRSRSEEFKDPCLGVCDLSVGNCNSLLVGSPKYLFQKLQRIQNCAARLVAQFSKAALTTPILQKLHWLPAICTGPVVL